MIKLERGNIKLLIERPEKGYRGTRFDWTGKVVQLYWKNIPFCTSENYKGRKVNGGRGFFNEFGLTDPVGYDDCKVGAFFPKIGVGLLCKETPEPYDFSHTYRMKPIHFSEVVDNSAVLFHCLNKDFDSAFFLKKEFNICEDGFTIDYFLENVGQCEIKTSEYVHNFLAPGGKNISKHTRLRFNGKLCPIQYNKGLSANAVVLYNEHTVNWSRTPNEEFFYENIADPVKNSTNWTLINEHLGIGISETVNFNPTKINLWGRKHVVSPEVFKGIHLKPGESDTWQRTYSVFNVG
ncbi:hypothetical protein SAMN06265379_101817 [Saccharicrinis carchari]|uniref:Aldose 1-epimerase n=1 Tax=Saccharicrinis carchari TaxID=1168039 RepID=A0A521BA02_SACCC|nr:hypothetical protein [Saccharicrinis carchari]SMO43897.1 hypothetical protein SAMN06265379_101817 [Saccharicrinis carchari]